MNNKFRLGCILFCSLTWSQVSYAQQTEPLHLKKIMQELSQHMQSTTAAIASEDWEMVAKLAPKIGQHEEPPSSEKIRILTYLGKNASAFRNYDHQTHEAAEEMRSAALKQDGKAVINAFAKIQTNCLACHTNFRAGFRQNFSKTEK